MDNNRKHGPGEIAGYLQSIVQLEALERMTHTLDTELADSQRVMLDIKAIFDSIPMQNSTDEGLPTDPIKYNIDELLDAETPTLLLPDMVENNFEVDIDAVILSMKNYAEEIRKKLSGFEQQQKHSPKPMQPLNLEECVTSLDQLGKRLANSKINNKNELNSKNANLEIKLTQLCQDVNMFTQMIQAKTALCVSNRNWTENQKVENSLYYDHIINKLLSEINEVTYLLQNKN